MEHELLEKQTELLLQLLATMKESNSNQAALVEKIDGLKHKSEDDNKGKHFG
jgi:hypothetical protein